jgi:ketosteroid isomerase-like protein
MADSSTTIADALFDAAEGGDFAAFAGRFQPDAVVWHNTDGVEAPIDQIVGIMAMVKAVVPNLTYKDRKTVDLPDGVFHQHVQTGTSVRGAALNVPTALRIYMADDAPDKIRRIEVYVDSAGVGSIGEELAEKMATAGD